MVRGFVELMAFLCELALLALLAVAGWSLSSGGLMSIALAVFYPALAILIWSVWMAPRSQRRLADPWRLVAQFLLFVAAGALAWPHHRLLGVLFVVVASAVFAASRVTHGVSGRT